MRSSPRWVPLNADGTEWKLVSWRGRYLGYIAKIDGVWLGEKFCCRKLRESNYAWGASGYVETVTSCSDCIVACPVSASN